MFLLYSSPFLLRDDNNPLIYALYPSAEIQFLKWKYSFGEKPSEVHPKPLENVILQMFDGIASVISQWFEEKMKSMENG